MSDIEQVLANLRATGRGDLADAFERQANTGPIGDDGSIDVNALLASRARLVEDLGQAAHLQANGHPAEDERSVLDAIAYNRPADNEPGPDEGRY